jgi:hypothetical protein
VLLLASISLPSLFLRVCTRPARFILLKIFRAVVLTDTCSPGRHLSECTWKELLSISFVFFFCLLVDMTGGFCLCTRNFPLFMHCFVFLIYLRRCGFFYRNYAAKSAHIGDGKKEKRQKIWGCGWPSYGSCLVYLPRLLLSAT